MCITARLFSFAFFISFDVYLVFIVDLKMLCLSLQDSAAFAAMINTLTKMKTKDINFFPPNRQYSVSYHFFIRFYFKLTKMFSTTILFASLVFVNDNNLGHSFISRLPLSSIVAQKLLKIHQRLTVALGDMFLHQHEQKQFILNHIYRPAAPNTH